MLTPVELKDDGHTVVGHHLAWTKSCDSERNPLMEQIKL